MKIKITAKNSKLNGTFIGITFKAGVAIVEGTDAELKRAIVFAQRSGLDFEEINPKEKEAPKKK